MPPVPAISNDCRVNLVELFSSFQGEGVLVGRRQIFLRFAGCNLECRYCDTQHQNVPECRVETTPGANNFLPISNPVSIDTVVKHLSYWKRNYPNLHHSLSLTGGEPLLHHEALDCWLPKLRSLFPIFLETNGLMTGALTHLLEQLDYISMDIKLPSTSGLSEMWDLHHEFLKLASSKKCCVKIVSSLETNLEEITRTSELIAGIDRNITLVIQPMTSELTKANLGSHLLMLQQQASRIINDVRIIPQTHTFMNVL